VLTLSLIDKWRTLFKAYWYVVGIIYLNMCVYEVRQKKKKETNPIAREPRVGGETQTDDYRTCSDLSQCDKAQLDRFTQYKWTHLQI
jgi:hypothetical protein